MISNKQKVELIDLFSSSIQSLLKENLDNIAIQNIKTRVALISKLNTLIDSIERIATEECNKKNIKIVNHGF